MTPGGYISGVGHAGLLLWLVMGWGLSSDPLEFDVMDVSVVSAQEFEAIRAATAPEAPVTDTPSVALPEPEVEVAPEPAPAEPDAPQTAETPPPVAPPERDSVPEVPETASLPPPPDPVPSPQAPEAPSVPTIVEDPTLEASPRPIPRPAERVSPTPIAPPPPDVAVAEEAQPPAEADSAAEEVIAETPQEATAPEEAASQIVTEADIPAASAPLASIRPQVRPNRPAPPAAPAPRTEGTTTAARSDDVAPDPEEAAPEVDEAAVDDAVAAALAAATSAAAPGPPLTGSEQEGFRVAVHECWDVDAGSQAARVVVTVAFSLSQQGRVEGDVRRLAASGGPEAAQESAFQAVRRAVLRCQNYNGRTGYELPPEKYDQWRDVELTFDPSDRAFQ
ncbi:hypothetical protein [Roseisalinus antarcticus]|uniref:Cell division and transport-associated protein TolA n=1 Tax=Roseisalinus antarcticus TaxID=254357 RepID=A0A1Y5SYH0_9RHOB|nr:hypothetical protein [Roseisalinus antarcticus]SLN50955.1 hypothetical protein ROA7023_02222 [Roseisalinus antarcticus]